MNQQQTLILKGVILFSLLFSVPAESFAGSRNIYGVQRKSGSRSITGVRSGSARYGKVYGGRGSSIRNNYFGGSKGTSSANKSKTKNMDSSATGWDDIYSGQLKVDRPVRQETAPEGMEAF